VKRVIPGYRRAATPIGEGGVNSQFVPPPSFARGRKEGEGSERISLGRTEGLVAPGVAGRLEEDEGTRF
jgi:hypothetical protein